MGRTRRSGRSGGTGPGTSEQTGGGGRRFGFQLTFFRTALAPTVTPRRSAWGARDVYMAHLALTDVDAGRFHARDRWARAALELAGATGDPLRVWLGDWIAEGVAPDGWPVRLRAGDGDVRIDLALARGKPPVLHGERGLSRKSAEPGNASYYYSLTRMPVSGEIEVGGRTFAVEGLGVDGPRVEHERPRAGPGRAGTGSPSSSTTAAS